MSEGAAPAGVVTFGEAMALVGSEHFGRFVYSPHARIGFGGAESNVAIGMRRLGIPATWVSRVGDDAFGDLIRRELRAEDVTTELVTDSARPTGLMVKERISPSLTRVQYYRAGSAASALTVDDLPLDKFGEFAMLHLTGITPALGDGAREATLEAARRAQAIGVQVSFDLNYRSRLWDRARASSFYRELLPFVDIVFAGEDEAKLMFDNDATPHELAVSLQHQGPSEAVIKMGERGALARSSKVESQVPARPATVVDTVGAGDSFVAGYLAARSRGADLLERLRVGAMAGSLTCETVGDWEGAPTTAEIDRVGLDPVQR